MMNEIVIEKLYDAGMTYLTTSVISEKDQRWMLRWFRSNKPDLCREVFADIQNQPIYRDRVVYREPETASQPLPVVQPVPQPTVQVPVVRQSTPQPIVQQPEVTPIPAPIIPTTPLPEDHQPINHVFDYREAIHKPPNRFVNRPPQEDFEG